VLPESHTSPPSCCWVASSLPVVAQFCRSLIHSLPGVAELPAVACCCSVLPRSPLPVVDSPWQYWDTTGKCWQVSKNWEGMVETLATLGNHNILNDIHALWFLHEGILSLEPPPPPNTVSQDPTGCGNVRRHPYRWPTLRSADGREDGGYIFSSNIDGYRQLLHHRLLHTITFIWNDYHIHSSSTVYCGKGSLSLGACASEGYGSSHSVCLLPL
jgi:hypothetical protein